MSACGFRMDFFLIQKEGGKKLFSQNNKKDAHSHARTHNRIRLLFLTKPFFLLEKQQKPMQQHNLILLTKQQNIDIKLNHSFLNDKHTQKKTQTHASF